MSGDVLMYKKAIALTIAEHPELLGQPITKSDLSADIQTLSRISGHSLTKKEVMLPQETSRLTATQTRDVYVKAAEENLKLFGSGAGKAGLTDKNLVDLMVQGDIDLQAAYGRPLTLDEVNAINRAILSKWGSYPSGMQPSGYSAGPKTKLDTSSDFISQYRIGKGWQKVARLSTEHPGAIEVKLGGKWEKVLEIKNAAELEHAPEFSWGYPKELEPGIAKFQKYVPGEPGYDTWVNLRGTGQLTTTQLPQEFRSVMQGGTGVGITKEGKITLSALPKRGVKDVTRVNIYGEQLKQPQYITSASERGQFSSSLENFRNAFGLKAPTTGAGEFKFRTGAAPSRSFTPGIMTFEGASLSPYKPSVITGRVPLLSSVSKYSSTKSPSLESPSSLSAYLSASSKSLSKISSPSPLSLIYSPPSPSKIPSPPSSPSPPSISPSPPIISPSPPSISPSPPYWSPGFLGFGGLPKGEDEKKGEKKGLKEWVVINPIRDLPAEFYGKSSLMNMPSEFTFGGSMTNFDKMYSKAGNELDRITAGKSKTFRSQMKWM
jgi:hypothetical protein